MTENKRILSTILIILVVGLCFYSLRKIGPGDIGAEEISSDDIMKHIRFWLMIKELEGTPGQENQEMLFHI